VILFVFQLGVLVVRLEGIAVCGYYGVHALWGGVWWGTMPFQRIHVGCSGWSFYDAVRVVGVPGRLIDGGVESIKKSPVWSPAGFSLVVMFLAMRNPAHSACFWW